MKLILQDIMTLYLEERRRSAGIYIEESECVRLTSDNESACIIA